MENPRGGKFEEALALGDGEPGTVNGMPLRELGDEEDGHGGGAGGTGLPPGPAGEAGKAAWGTEFADHDHNEIEAVLPAAESHQGGRGADEDPVAGLDGLAMVPPEVEEEGDREEAHRVAHHGESVISESGSGNEGDRGGKGPGSDGAGTGDGVGFELEGGGDKPTVKDEKSEDEVEDIRDAEDAFGPGSIAVGAAAGEGVEGGSGGQEGNAEEGIADGVGAAGQSGGGDGIDPEADPPRQGRLGGNHHGKLIRDVEVAVEEK